MTAAAIDLTPWIPLADRIAGGFARKLPPSVGYDEVRAAARAGLWDALAKAAANGTVANEAYIKVRVRGEILDALRALDWLPRRARQKGDCARVVHSADIGPDDGRAWEPVSEDDGPEEGVLRDDARREVEDAIEALRATESTRNITILHAHYFLGKNFDEIAEEQGITAPRVSQLLYRAREKMRAHIESRRECFGSVPHGGVPEEDPPSGVFRIDTERLQSTSPAPNFDQLTLDAFAAIERGVTDSAAATEAQVPPEVKHPPPQPRNAKELTIAEIEQALSQSNWRVGAAANALGVSYLALVRVANRLGVSTLEPIPAAAAEPTALPPPRQRIAELHAAGWHPRRIAGCLGCNIYLVEKVLRDAQ